MLDGTKRFIAVQHFEKRIRLLGRQVHFSDCSLQRLQLVAFLSGIGDVANFFSLLIRNLRLGHLGESTGVGKINAGQNCQPLEVGTRDPANENRADTRIHKMKRAVGPAKFHGYGQGISSELAYGIRFDPFRSHARVVVSLIGSDSPESGVGQFRQLMVRFPARPGQTLHQRYKPSVFRSVGQGIECEFESFNTFHTFFVSRIGEEFSFNPSQVSKLLSQCNRSLGT